MDPEPHEVERWGGGQCLRSGVKPQEGPPQSGGGVESSLDDTTRHGKGRGVESSQDGSTPIGGRGGGVDSWQDDSTTQTNGGGVDLSWDDSTPREGGGPEGDKTPGAPTASRSWQGEDGCGRGGGDENPPPTRPTQEHPTNDGNGTAPQGAAAMGTAGPAERMETEAEGAGHPAAHPTGTVSAAAAVGPVGRDRAS